MLGLDATQLARLQFALNIGFHILFPAITIGLAWILLYFRTRYTLSRNHAWEYAYYFWVKIFALTFAVGIVTGVTMSFQFGTNWPGFMERVGNIAGPLLGYEVLTAFFIEATFLAIMLFGKNRVSNRVHMIATSLVALGTTVSAFWILSLDSWMQTPQGYTFTDGKFYAAHWLQIIFNPSFPYRFSHMFVASLLTSAFLIAGISAWRMLRKVDGPATALVLKTGVAMAVVLAPLQLFLGDQHGLNTFKHQPAKIAAIEAIWNTESGAAFTLFGWPDESLHRTLYALKIPDAASLILTHEPNGVVQGLSAFPSAHPPVAIVFWAFRVMVGVGLLMILVAWISAWPVLRKRGPPRGVLSMLSWMTFAGWIATVAGWVVTEVGRQPWLVQDMLTVADAVAPHAAHTVAGTLIAYAVLYAFLLTAYIATLRYLATQPAESLKMTGPVLPAEES
jgi:cytochrome d ubiquinol oxidase subunit I